MGCNGTKHSELMDYELDIPSGKRSQNYGKIHHFELVNQLQMSIFNSYIKLPEGIHAHMRSMVLLHLPTCG